MKKRKWILGVLSFVMGGICGFVGIKCIFMILPEEDLNVMTLCGAVALILVTVYLAVFLHTFLHETGHMVFGLLTGYRFSSIRFLSFMFIKEESGKIRLKKYKVAGTGGQCLMLPPEDGGEGCPYVLYNLGGCIVNLVIGIIAVGVHLIAGNSIISLIFYIIGIIGIFTAVINGIPVQEASNDGYNTLLFSKNKDALKIFHIELNIVEKQSRGVPVSEMPKEWFDYLEGIKEFDNNMGVSAYTVVLGYYVEKKDFGKVKEMCVYAEENIKGMMALHEGIIKAEHLFVEIMTGMDKDKIEELTDDKNRKTYELLKTQISMLRVWYAYYLLYKNDKDKAEKYLDKFNKSEKTYPYKADFESEKNLIKYVDSIAAGGVQPV